MTEYLSENETVSINIDHDLFIKIKPYFEEVWKYSFSASVLNIDEIYDFIISGTSLGENSEIELYISLYSILKNAYMLYYYEDKLDIECFNNMKKMFILECKVEIYMLGRYGTIICSYDNLRVYIIKHNIILNELIELADYLADKDCKLQLLNDIPITINVSNMSEEDIKENFEDEISYFYNLVTYIQKDMNLSFYYKIIKNLFGNFEQNCKCNRCQGIPDSEENSEENSEKSEENSEKSEDSEKCCPHCGNKI